MSTATTESSPSGLVVSLENLLFDYPGADIILRSRDFYQFRVLKLYIVHSSPALGEKLLVSPNPRPAESDVKATAANALPAVQLPLDGAILLSLLSYIFPVPHILPPTIEQIMELLSVAQMYKMDVMLTHIRTTSPSRSRHSSGRKLCSKSILLPRNMAFGQKHSRQCDAR